MTNDSGKKPEEIWMLVLDNGDKILRDFEPMNEDTFIHGITNERHSVVSKHYLVEPTPCANCERLELTIAALETALKTWQEAKLEKE